MTDRKESKDAILGELESIKSLLSEEDLAAIPILEDTVVTPTPKNSEVEDVKPALEFPLLTSIDDEIPVLEDTLDEIPLLNESTSMTTDATADPFSADEFITLEVEHQLNTETDSPSIEQSLDAESLFSGVSQFDEEDLTKEESIFEQEPQREDASLNGNTPQRDDNAVADEADTEEHDVFTFDDIELTEQLEPSAAEDIFDAFDATVDLSEGENTAQDTAADTLDDSEDNHYHLDATEPSYSTDSSSLENFEAFLEISEAFDSPSVEPDEQSSHTSPDQDTTEFDGMNDSSSGLPEPILAPNALPGQQSLFDISREQSTDTQLSSSFDAIANHVTADSDDDQYQAASDEEITSAENHTLAETDAPSMDVEPRSPEIFGTAAVTEKSCPQDLDIPAEATNTHNIDTEATTELEPATTANHNVEKASLSHELDTLEATLDKIAESSPPHTQERPKTAKGENPFLPKHIRERLHTERSLMEIIKDDPANALDSGTSNLSEPPHVNTAAKGLETSGTDIQHEQLEQIVDDVLREQLPKIEEEIRRRLLVSLRKTP